MAGAQVTARQGAAVKTALTDLEGRYGFEDLAPGSWTLEVAMRLFQPQKKTIAVEAAASTPLVWELELLPESERRSLVTKAPPRGGPEIPVTASVAAGEAQRKNKKAENGPAEPAAAGPPPAAAPSTAAVPENTELAQRAADGFLINGSSNNGAASPFAQFPAFGNNRRGPRSQYNGNLGLVANNAVFDARNYSLTGQNTPKPGYSRLQGLASFGGPIRIPKLIRRNGPNLTINYQWTRNRTATTESALLPTVAQRGGDLAAGPIALDPQTRQPFAGNQIPASRLDPSAFSLLRLYPLPNTPLSSGYNFQTPIVRGLHQDDLQTRLSKQIGRRNNVNGSFAWQSTRTDSPNVFGFLDTGSVRGLNGAVNWRHNFQPRLFTTLGLEYSSLAIRRVPYYANRENVSGGAGITGNDQSPANWGPPALSFSSGIALLSDIQAARNRNQTVGMNGSIFLNRGRHNVQMGGVYRRLQFNVVSQQDARGALAFTGQRTGNDFAGLLLGAPDTSSIAYGNADKYLRAHSVEGYWNDDFRINPSITLNVGVRYEYSSPVEEKYGRLINIDTGANYTSLKARQDDLPRADRNNLAPRVAIAWRPVAASSLIVRAGYGIYYDSSVYTPIALQMAQQAPLSRNLRVESTPDAPLALSSPFPATASAPTFGVDRNFRIGYSQNWQLIVQRDLPLALQMQATYNGGKGTRAQQQFLPNTFPAGGSPVCAVCPSGYSILESNGNATRHALQLQLRRRLRSGFATQAQYAWAKSLDNAALGGRGQAATLIAQNWLDLSAERGRSSFDQRHAIALTMQYSPRMGQKGGNLHWSLRDWTLTGQFNGGTGLPQTPVYFSPVRGTGVTGSLRPDYVAIPGGNPPAGRALNPAAYVTPAPGRWGNAGRNSITGPGQLVLNTALSRTFRGTDRVSMDFRVDAANVLNTVTYSAWNVVAGNPQFGLPAAANAMRTIQSSFRVRF